jgi:exonuclease SbcC
MSGLRRLVVENFQSHEHSEVIFGPGLNVIVGPSDFGKSALVRALRWLYYNEPRGANFIRVGARTCRVMVELDDGTAVTRLRSISGKKENQYILQRQGEEKQVYVDLREVPLEIVQVLDVRKMQVDERNSVELNLGGQLEGPFLLAENGAVRAKVIGQLGGVHILDWAQKSTGTDLRRLREQEGQLAAEIAGLESDLSNYSHLSGLESNISRIREMRDRITGIAADVDTLSDLQRQWQEVSAALAIAGQDLDALQSLDRAERLALELEAAVLKHGSLSDIAAELGQVKQGLELNRGQVEALAVLDDIERKLGSLEALSGSHARLTQLAEEISQVSAQLARAGKIAELTRSVPEAEALWQRVEASYRQWLELARAAGELAVVVSSLKGADRVVDRSAQLEQAESCLTAAGETRQKLQVFTDLLQNWVEEDHKYQGASLAAERYQKEMDQLLQDYGRLLAQLGRCPVCFGELTGEAVERALAEYR